MINFRFTESGCSSCGSYNEKQSGTRYCEHGKKPRRFKSADPKRKAPKWCPKRNTPPIVRVYGFVNDDAKAINSLGQSLSGVIILSTPHYKLIFESRTLLTAGDFYKKANSEPVKELIECDVKYGNIVEINDGIVPYYFYYKNYKEFEKVDFAPPEMEAEQL